MAKAQNRSAREHCPICEDSGWVALAGTVKVAGATYERGSAPCHWCEQGVVAAARNRRATADYTIEDVVLPSPPPEANWRAEGRRRLQELRSRTGSIGREMP